LTQILRKNNYLSAPDVSLAAGLLSNARRKDLFPLPRGTRTEPFLVTFFFFLFFILARYVRFFSGTRAANWNIKSASVMMR
jgi:hypothetical protein